MSRCSCGRYKAEYETPKYTEEVCYFCDEGAVILEPDEFVCKQINPNCKYDIIQKLEERLRNLKIRKIDYPTKWYENQVKYLEQGLEVIKSMEVSDT